MAKLPFGPCILGVDYSIPPHLLPQGALADARNIVPTLSGLPTGRSGMVKLSTVVAASRITSLHEFRSGTTRNTLMSYGTAIACYNSGTGVFDDEITGLTTGKMFQWVNFAGKAIGVNEGVDHPQYFSDTSTHGDLAGSPPHGRAIVEWANRVWMVGDSTNLATLTGCSLNDPTTWSGATGATGNFSGIVGDSKDPLIAGFGFFDMLLLGKKNALYKVVPTTGYPPTDATNLEIRPVYTKDADSTGFTSPWAITQVGNDVIYLDGFDIKRLSGIQEFGDVETASIIPHLRDFLKATAHKDYLQYTQFFHYKKAKQIWVSIPKSATTHFVFILDYKFKSQTGGRYAFYPLYNMELTCINGIENGEVLDIYAGDESGYVQQLDTGNDDNGTAIERYAVYPFSGNDPENGVFDRHETRKQFHSAETYIKPSAATLTIETSYAADIYDDVQVRTSGNYTALDTETVSSWNGTGTKNKSIRLFGLNGSTLAMKFRHNTVAENFTIYPGVLHYENKTRARIV